MTQANDNRTFLYRIRRKSDGLFLSCAPSDFRIFDEWGPTGTFWKKAETITKHLFNLCELKIICFNKGKAYVYDMRDGKRKRGKNQQIQDSINPFWVMYDCNVPEPQHVRMVWEWLDKYEVIATEVTVHGDHIITAEDFIGVIEDRKESGNG